MLYLWIKALHVLSIIAWMAGMLYLPRLFVYHTTAAKGSAQSETFKVMERRLLRFIMTPSMLVAWLSGIAIASMGGFFASPWLSIKLILVLIMSGLHGYFFRVTREFAEDRNQRPQSFYRMINEVPTILLIFIVILVVVKPF